MVTGLDRWGYAECRYVTERGFEGNAFRSEDGGYVIRGKCRTCGDVIEAGISRDEGQRFIMPSDHKHPGLVGPFDEHWRWHEVRRSASWDTVYELLSRAARAAYGEAAGADLMRSLERK